tara:strand:+ start:1099 stop:2073 length:975 start_codon:yes stop_codon:yes gene_type:complete
MQGYRKTLKFLVPRNKDALGTFSLEHRDVVPLYINPQQINMRERKIINKQLTKGGYLVQYWGEELPVMSVNGTTGSSGIEGIHILRDIYRYEQIAVKHQLLKKMENQTESMIGNLTGLAEMGQKSTSFWGSLSNVFGNTGINDMLGSQWLSGSKSVVDSWVSAFNQTADNAVQRTVLHPSLGAFAVSMDVYFQGERYRGYFTNFSVSERAASPGLFDYNFEFIITKRMGKRTNFMPWHRSPVDAGGDPIPAAIPYGKEAGGIDRGLSYPPTYDNEALLNDEGDYSFRFAQDPDSLVTEGEFAGESTNEASEVEVNVNRYGNISD